ncbi:MAG: adenylate kinase [Cyanobacteriota bacterium]
MDYRNNVMKEKIDLTQYNKILIVGCSCSGKTTLAKKLSSKINRPHIELDEIYWLENWTARSNDDFKNIVLKKLEDKKWILDGNYRILRENIWKETDVIIWLNYKFSTILYSAMKRSFRRIFFKEKSCNNNIETLSRTLFSKKSIFYWIYKTYKPRREEYKKIFLEEKKFNFIEINNRYELDLFF